MADRGPKKRLADRTVDKALEAQCAADIALRYQEQARAEFLEIIRDGVVTLDEARSYLAKQESALMKQATAVREANDVVRMAERVNERQKIGLLFAEYDDDAMPPTAIANARTAGIEPPQAA